MAFDKNAVLRVDVVAADQQVWQGEAKSVVARTVEGDIGILVNHETLIAALIPCAADVTLNTGEHKVFALDGGFLSVEDNRVTLLSQFAREVVDLDPDDAKRELAQLKETLPASGELTEEQEKELTHAIAQLRAAERIARH